ARSSAWAPTCPTSATRCTCASPPKVRCRRKSRRSNRRAGLAHSHKKTAPSSARFFCAGDRWLFGFHAAVLHRLQLAQVDAAHRRLQLVDAVGVAVRLDREALADDHAVLAGLGLVVPLLVDEVAIVAVGLLVAGFGFLLLLRRHRAG